MPDHHPHTAPDKPTRSQQRYLRQLAERTGTSFIPPATNAEANRQIKRLERRTRDPRADRIHDQRVVQADLQWGSRTRPRSDGRQPPRRQRAMRPRAGARTDRELRR